MEVVVQSMLKIIHLLCTMLHLCTQDVVTIVVVMELEAVVAVIILVELSMTTVAIVPVAPPQLFTAYL